MPRESHPSGGSVCKRFEARIEELKSQKFAMYRELAEYAIRDVIGQDGLERLSITIDSSDPVSPKLVVDGPEELKAKAREAIASLPKEWA